MDTLRLTWVALYIIVDIAYVFLSYPFYKRAFDKIRGSNSKPANRIWAVVASWVVLGLGWYYFAAPTAVKWAPKIGCPYRSGAIVGILYGLVVYGTWNFIMAAFFIEWTPAIMLRDLAWGILWAATTLAFYTAKATGMPLKISF